MVKRDSFSVMSAPMYDIIKFYGLKNNFLLVSSSIKTFMDQYVIMC